MDMATLGINFAQITTDRLLDLCKMATNRIDNIAGQTLRATAFYEELNGPGHRVGFTGQATRFITSKKPVLSVISGQSAYGGPPFKWNPISLTAMVPENSPFSTYDSASWDGSVSGQAAILIGPGYVGWGNGRQGTRIGIRYLAGWPVCSLEPSAIISGTLTSGSTSVTLSSTTGVLAGATISGSGIPSETTILSLAGSVATLSQAATISGTSSLTVGYAPGVTSLNVDDITAWSLGVTGTVQDGTYSETALSVTTVPQVSGAISGAGSVTLSAPTTYAHAPGVLLTAMPPMIRWATMLAVKVEAIERGATASTAQSMPGRSVGGGGSSITRTLKDIRDILKPFARVW